MIQAINAAMCIGIYHIGSSHMCAASKEACFIKQSYIFQINKNDTGYHEALSLSLTRVRELHSTTDRANACSCYYLKSIYGLSTSLNSAPRGEIVK
jgi:hypothetical protein